MNSDLQNLTPKVEDGGTTPQGKLAASEWNILLEAVKLLDRTSGEIGTSEVLRIVRDAGYATQDWVKELMAGISTPDGYMSIVGDQQITGVKDFVNGLRIGGAPITYDAATQSFFFEGNIVLSGGVAMRAALGALDAPTIMDALVVDGSSLKVIDGVLTFVGQTGGGVADSVLWEDVVGKPSWIGSTKPSYNYSEITGTPNLSAYLTASALSGYATQDWVLSQRYLTGISSSMITDALGYTPPSTSDLDNYLPITGGVANGSVFIGDYDNTSNYYLATTRYGHFARMNNLNDGCYIAFGERPSKGTFTTEKALKIGDNGIQYSDNGGSSYNEVIHSGNYSNYALPITGGTVNGNVVVRDSLTVATSVQIPTNGDRITFYSASGTYTKGILAMSIYNTYLEAPLKSDSKSADKPPILIGWRDGTYPIFIASNTNVAFGGTTASEKLHVYGNILASGDITMRYTSDMRLKRNRESINASEILMSLGEVQSFEYVDSEVEKNHRYAGRHIGLMYQNVVGTALDRMCHEREDGFGSLNYIDTDYLALLGGVGQEHEVRLRAQAVEIKDLRRENNELKRRIYRLERMV